MINDKTAVKALESRGIYCIECSMVTKYTAKQIKDIIAIHRNNHPNVRMCVITKNTASITEEGIDILCGIDNLIIRLSSVNDERILSNCNEKNLSDLLTASLYTPAEIKRINHKIDKILSKINPNWSKAQTAVYVYNYIMGNTKYDPEYFNKNSLNIRSLRGFLSQEVVCAGYSYMYKELMDRLDIPCEYIIGKTSSGGHAWNTITLNGKTYYCDLTWDSQLYKTDTDNEKNLCFFAQDVDEFEKKHIPFRGVESRHKENFSSMTEKEKKQLLSSVLSYSQSYNFERFKKKDGSIFNVAKIGSYNEFAADSAKSLQAYISFSVNPDKKISSPKIYLADFDLDKERKKSDDLKIKSEAIRRNDDLTELEKSKKLEEINKSIARCRNRFEIIRKLFCSDRNDQYLGGIDENDKYYYDKSNANRSVRIRILRRSNGTSVIIIDPMFKTNVSGINLHSYNILTLSEERDKFNFNKYKVLTENDLFTLESNEILTDTLLSNNNLKNRNKNSHGYLGFIKDGKWYYHTSVSNALDRSLLTYSADGSMNINVNHM